MKRTKDTSKTVKSFTIRQEKLKKEMLENVRSGKSLTKRELLIKAGYSKAIATQPSRVITPELEESVRQDLEKILPLELGVNAVLRSVNNYDVKKERFNEEVSDKIIRSIYGRAGKEVLEIILKEKSDSTKSKPAFQKIAYYKTISVDSQLRASEIILKVHGLIKKRNKDDDKQNPTAVFNTFVDMRKFLMDFPKGPPIQIEPDTN